MKEDKQAREKKVIKAAPKKIAKTAAKAKAAKTAVAVASVPEAKVEPQVTAEVKLPFRRPDSVVAQVFQMCMAGTTVDAIKAFVEKNDCGPRRILRKIRRGVKSGRTWKVDENKEKGTIKVTYPIQ